MNHDSKGRGGCSVALLLIFGVVLGVVLSRALPSDLLAFLGQGKADPKTEHGAEEHTLWTCSMHPQVIEEEPGQCPICHMDLTPLRNHDADPASAGADSTATATPTEWTCADHSIIVEDAPGTCPIDGLDLVPVHDGAPHGPAEATADASRSAAIEVQVAPAMVQKMNVRTAAVTHRDLTRPIRTVGYLEYDPQRMVTVTTKYSGFVEKVYVNYVGEKVRRGQPLFEIYSPQLVQTEQEFLAALAFADEMKEAPEDAYQRALSMVDSARQRLSYWDISQHQIDQLEATGEILRSLAVTSPADGLVMQRLAGLEGMALTPGMEIFHLADLSSLWLSVELFEDQVAWVQEGTSAEIRLSYFPGEVLHGNVRYLEPELSEKTRTVQAMIEVPNPGGKLRKGMYATVDLQPMGVKQALVVPTEAVLRTGRRSVVVLALGEGRFMPRQVTVGYEAGGFSEILQGVEEGEQIVTSAQFLLDSESKLRTAVQKMIAERRADDGPSANPTTQDPTTATDHGSHGH